VIEPRSHTIFRLLRRLLLVGLLLVLVAWAVIPQLSTLPVVRQWVEKTVARATGWDVHIGALRVSRDLSVMVSEIEVAVPSQPPFVTVERARASLRPAAALAGRPVSLHIEAPHLYLAHLPVRSREDDMRQSPMVRGRLPLEGALIVGGYVHVPRKPEDVVIGPFTLTVESAESGEDLRLSGATALPGAAGTAEWSARLGAGLGDSEASITADIPRLGELLRAWSDLQLPSDAAAAAMSLSVQLRGKSEDRAGLELRAAVRPSGEGTPAVIEGSGEVELPAMRAAVDLVGAGFSWHDAELTRAVSGLDLRARLAAAPDGAGIAGEIDLRVTGGEVLWDRFYADLSRHPVQLKGKMRQAGAAFSVRDLVASAPGLGKVTISGSREARKERWRVGLDVAGTGELFELAVRDPLKEDHPVLERTRLGGHLGGNLEYTREADGRRRLDGSIDLGDGRVSVASPEVEIRDLNVQLPIALVEGRAERAQARSGVVQIGSLSAAGITAAGIAVPLQVEVNRITLAEPVRVALLGGALDLMRLAVNIPHDAAPRADVALAVRQLDLAQISRAAGWPALSGMVSGEIPNLSASEGRIRSDGEIRVAVFGGEARVRNVRVEELLSPVPALGLDLDFENLSLGEMTQALEVGRITGLARGGVRDLAIVNGQPLRFEAWMETVPRAGVSQRISVTAIRQLSILGGAGGDPLTQGLLSFFDEYRYAKMGFRCRLENDRFTLRGVEQFEGQEYLVVGAVLPPRVNVVSHTRVIAFSEMVRRLARIASL
jgi:hypothetical protein